MTTTYIYILQDKYGDVRYVGKTDYPKDRLAVHRCRAKYKNPHLDRWIKKAGEITLYVLDEVPKENWQFWEKWYICLYKSWGFRLANLTSGGDGCDGYKHTEESLAKSIANRPSMRGENNPMYGSGGGFLGKKHSPSAIQKLRVANIGKNNPQYGKRTHENVKKILRKTHGEKTEINGVIYDSMREACEKTGIDRSTYRYKIKKGYKYENNKWVKL